MEFICYLWWVFHQGHWEKTLNCKKTKKRSKILFKTHYLFLSVKKLFKALADSPLNIPSNELCKWIKHMDIISLVVHMGKSYRKYHEQNVLQTWLQLLISERSIAWCLSSMQHGPHSYLLLNSISPRSYLLNMVKWWECSWRWKEGMFSNRWITRSFLSHRLVQN